MMVTTGGRKEQVFHSLDDSHFPCHGDSEIISYVVSYHYFYAFAQSVFRRNPKYLSIWSLGTEAQQKWYLEKQNIFTFSLTLCFTRSRAEILEVLRIVALTSVF